MKNEQLAGLEPAQMAAQVVRQLVCAGFALCRQTSFDDEGRRRERWWLQWPEICKPVCMTISADVAEWIDEEGLEFLGKWCDRGRQDITDPFAELLLKRKGAIVLGDEGVVRRVDYWTIKKQEYGADE